ncbi:ABC transporter ATP-binding protein [Oceanobacillus picturae]|uniref:ABC transporter ATP-binding protein n=1 Tax=Oceanobacillus picturae TaxID=171693 RepID=UPI000E69C346|nr:ATP-binding cassette domain-containing protein [Oceanobacillus picturae]RIU91110.1 ATP-binding cassette domain-containing protein [Oceanobacillus picturae]
MEILSAKSISFTYPLEENPALREVDFHVHKGEFVVLCGASGSGKSTLLHLVKQEIAPHGKLEGSIFYNGTQLEKNDTPPDDIGIVFQDPENQIVMDNVMEELLFGMENKGYQTEDMRKKVAEMTHYFGLTHLLDKKTSELSGGEKQKVNLVSVLLLEPDLLLLDEPTAQLDPIAAKEFIQTLTQLNREFGITILMVEHRLEELFAAADRVLVLEGGVKKVDAPPREAVAMLHAHPILNYFLPSASRLFLHFQPEVDLESIPVNVKEGRDWLLANNITADSDMEVEQEATPLFTLKEIDFQYNKDTAPVLHNLSLSVNKGELLAILGANGTGKSTLLKVMAGILRPQHGKVLYDGKKQKKHEKMAIRYLPQNPALYFLEDTLMAEYRQIVKKHQRENGEAIIHTLLDTFGLKGFAERHPADLSGGELQKAALLGTLLEDPKILLIDEPTKGLDPYSKRVLGTLLEDLRKQGLTIVMVTHDVEFAANYATRCSMLFQGDVSVVEGTRAFFKGNTYYTTVMNRMTRKSAAPLAVTLEEAKENWRVQRKP